MAVEPRVAFFTDSYLEVNGVAQTSRQFAGFARHRGLHLLCAHAGHETRSIEEDTLKRLELKRSRAGFRFEADQRHDFLLWRHARLAIETVRNFRADLIHITGPSDVGQLGAYVAHKLRLPVVISWHTNLHEYAARRLSNLTAFLPAGARGALACVAERQSLQALFRFYKIGRVLLAPNEELRDLVEQNCRRPTYLMQRGVDTNLFSPAKRDRRDEIFTLGYVGRLAPEKNVRFLAELEKRLLAAGKNDLRFVIVGTGSELHWLRQNMRCAEFPGVLKGEALAEAYANFDLFIFPSHTDTFGNVVLEAQASGVPAIVTGQGGPRFIIRDRVTGFVADGENEFIDAVIALMSQPERLRQMREEARQLACAASWDSVFEQVYRAYAIGLQQKEARLEAPARVHRSISEPDVIN